MKFMVCYDGSNASRSALRVATKYAKAFEVELFLVASLEKGAEDEQEVIRQLEIELENGKERLASEGIECETRLLVRGATSGEVLTDFAREQGIDEIAIGIQKRSKVSKFFFGSTAQYVILNAPCPVITVK